MALVHLVQSLGAFDHGQDPRLEPREALAAGEVSNRIP